MFEESVLQVSKSNLYRMTHIYNQRPTEIQAASYLTLSILTRDGDISQPSSSSDGSVSRHSEVIVVKCAGDVWVKQ